jgi:hypothetical protein
MSRIVIVINTAVRNLKILWKDSVYTYDPGLLLRHPAVDRIRKTTHRCVIISVLWAEIRTEHLRNKELQLC